MILCQIIYTSQIVVSSIKFIIMNKKLVLVTASTVGTSYTAVRYNTKSDIARNPPLTEFFSRNNLNVFSHVKRIEWPQLTQE